MLQLLSKNRKWKFRSVIDVCQLWSVINAALAVQDTCDICSIANTCHRKEKKEKGRAR